MYALVQDVKEATETQEVPILPEELARWILVRALRH